MLELYDNIVQDLHANHISEATQLLLHQSNPRSIEG